MLTAEEPAAVDTSAVVAQHGPFLLTVTTTVATGDPSYEEWAAAFNWCKDVESASPFWVGDLLAYGDRYGEMASQVLDASQYAEQTLHNAKYVCSQIPPERRRAAVPFSHHAEVAALPPSEQTKWLDKCETEQLTREQLRVQLKHAKNTAAGQAVELWVTCSCSSLDDQTQLVEKLRAEGRSVKATAKDAPKEPKDPHV